MNHFYLLILYIIFTFAVSICLAHLLAQGFSLSKKMIMGQTMWPISSKIAT